MNNNGLDLTYNDIEILACGLRDKIEDIATSLETDKADPLTLACYTDLYARLYKALTMYKQEQDEDGQPTA